MQSLLVTQNGVEKVRVPLVKRSYLLGRSPSCDIVIRGKKIGPVQFILEWVGEGDFDPKSGLWMLTSLNEGDSRKDSVASDSDQGTMGDVISNQKTNILGFDFSLVVDRLAETTLKKGVLSRQLESDEIASAKFNPLARNNEVLEVISFRNDLGVIIDVQHFSQAKTKFPNLSFASTQINFIWESANGSLGFIEDRGSFVDYKLLSHGVDYSQQIKKGGQKLPIRSSDMYRLKVANRDYILRFVPFVDVTLENEPIYRDAYVQVITMLCVFFIGFSYWIQNSPLEEVPVEVKPERVATVEVKEFKEPPPPPKKEEVVETKPPEKELKPKETVEKKVEPTAKPSDIKKQVLKAEVKAKPSAASAPSVQNVAPTEKARAGLNNSAPVQNVNRIGLLGKLKSGGTSNAKVSADMALNQGIVSETVSGNTGFTVQKAPMGELGVGRKEGGGSGPGLAAAATTMKNPNDFNAKSVGPIGLSGSGSLNSVGAALRGDQSGTFKSNGGSSTGDLIGGGGFDVEGGLTKEDIRKALAEHRRAIRNCYEIALLSKKDLQGRQSLRWKIQVDGSVEFIEQISSDLKMPSLESCVQGVVKGIVFPRAPNNKTTTVRYPFIFQGKK